MVCSAGFGQRASCSTLYELKFPFCFHEQSYIACVIIHAPVSAAAADYGVDQAWQLEPPGKHDSILPPGKFGRTLDECIHLSQSLISRKQYGLQRCPVQGIKPSAKFEYAAEGSHN